MQALGTYFKYAVAVLIGIEPYGSSLGFRRGQRNGMQPALIANRVSQSKRSLADAVDWEFIEKNPFAKVQAKKPSLKSNVFVERELIERVMARQWHRFAGRLSPH